MSILLLPLHKKIRDKPKNYSRLLRAIRKFLYSSTNRFFFVFLQAISLYVSIFMLSPLKNIDLAGLLIFSDAMRALAPFE